MSIVRPFSSSFTNACDSRSRGPSSIVRSTGFELLVADTVRELAPPTEQELDELRRLHDSDVQRPAELQEVTATT